MCPLTFMPHRLHKTMHQTEAKHPSLPDDLTAFVHIGKQPKNLKENNLAACITQIKEESLLLQEINE